MHFNRPPLKIVLFQQKCVSCILVPNVNLMVCLLVGLINGIICAVFGSTSDWRICSSLGESDCLHALLGHTAQPERSQAIQFMILTNTLKGICLKTNCLCNGYMCICLSKLIQLRISLNWQNTYCSSR